MSATGQPKVLVVEDTAEYRLLIVKSLSDSGLELITAEDGQAGLALARDSSPDVVVLDLGLPQLDGLEVCRSIRTFSDAYILMLTARSDEVDKIVGLGVGADDYMTKPFSSRELAARVHGLLRRRRSAPPPAETVRRVGDLVIDPLGREVHVRGQRVELTRIEFDLLETLTANPRAVLTRAQLLSAVWNDGWYGDERLVDVHISKLRRKIRECGDEQEYVRTVRGVGFRMAQPSGAPSPAVPTR